MYEKVHHNYLMGFFIWLKSIIFHIMFRLILVSFLNFSLTPIKSIKSHCEKQGDEAIYSHTVIASFYAIKTKQSIKKTTTIYSIVVFREKIFFYLIFILFFVFLIVPPWRGNQTNTNLFCISLMGVDFYFLNSAEG